MKCPTCDAELKKVQDQDVELDLCQDGCGGIWFDNFELKKFDEPHESMGEHVLNLEISSGIKVDHERKRSCPKCDGIKMIRHYFSVKKDVEIDECGKCGGIWLDTGELSRIRSLFKTEEDRKKAADEYFDEVFGDEFQRMKDESGEKLAKARRIANIFRYICPSYWIPGNQEWGAF